MTSAATPSASPTATADAAAATSWLPLIIVVLAQIQASFAVNALTVSMAGITTDLDTEILGSRESGPEHEPER